MNNPLISVAIPAYNHEEFIAHCLHSVLVQDYPQLELIVIDDGSVDQTRNVIENFLAVHATRFHRVVFKSRPNRGVSATSNECFAHATGEWVHLLGSDDLLKPGKISRQQRAYLDWQQPDIGLLFADADFIDRQGQPVVKQIKEVFPPGPDAHGYQRLFVSNRIPNPTVAIRRAAFEAVGGFDEHLFLEDWDMWLRLAARFPIARVPEVLASYRYHPGNTHQREGEMLEATLRTFGKFLLQHPGLLDAGVIMSNWKKNLHRLARWARRNKPSLLPQIFAATVQARWKAPTTEHYLAYAELLAEHRRSRNA